MRSSKLDFSLSKPESMYWTWVFSIGREMKKGEVKKGPRLIKPTVRGVIGGGEAETIRGKQKRRKDPKREGAKRSEG